MTKKTIETDVVIVGCGVAGAMAAYKQLLKERSVIIVEQGERLTASKIESLFESKQSMHGRQLPKVPIRVSKNPYNWQHLPSVAGGLARIFAAIAMRMRPKEFERWPISYDEIEPFYSEAESLMNVSGNAGADPSEGRRSSSYKFSLPDVSELSERLTKGAKLANTRPFQHPLAIKFSQCRRCRFCNEIPCIYGAKWSPDVFVDGLSKKQLKILYQTSVHRIHVSDKSGDQQVEALTARNLRTDEEIRIKAKRYILAGGGLLTPTLLLNSGLGDWNQHIGANFMKHCSAVCVGVFRHPISAEEDFQKRISISDFYFGDQKHEKSEVFGTIQQEVLPPLKNLISWLPRAIQVIVERVYFHAALFLVIAEDEPQQDNRIVKSGYEVSSGKIVVQHRFSKRDKYKRRFLLNKAKTIMSKSGALFSTTLPINSIYHVCGTVRMGNDPSESACDKNGRLWSVDNLYVCDSSLFPTSSGVNPSLTIAANSLRVSEQI